MDEKAIRRVRFFTVAIILNLLFIWGNSLMPGPVSAALSRFVGNVLSFFFPGGNTGQIPSGHGLLRKIAHFSEFCSLGLLLSCLLFLLKKPYLISLPLGIVTAAADECIQLLVPGRGPHIRDVGIDTLGVIAGIGVFTILLAIRKRKKHKILEEKQL